MAILLIARRNIEINNVGIFLHLADISDIGKKSLHIPDIKALCGKTGSPSKLKRWTKKSRSQLLRRDLFIALNHSLSLFKG